MVLFFTDLVVDIGDIWVPIYDFSWHHWFSHGFSYLLPQGTSFSVPVLCSFHVLGTLHNHFAPNVLVIKLLSYLILW